MTMSYDTLVKNFNDLASRLTTVESLLQSNDVNTGAADPGTDVNGEQIAPEQSADTTFNFPGYNSQNTDGQQQVMLDGLQSQIDSLNLAMNQAQLLLSGGTNDLNQANALDANQSIGDDGSQGKGGLTPANVSGLSSASGLSSLYGYYYTGTNSLLSTDVLAVPVKATTKVWDTVSGAFDGTKFICQIPGYYMCIGQANISPGFSNLLYYAFNLGHGGSINTSGELAIGNISGNTGMTLQASYVAKMAAGDTIQYFISRLMSAPEARTITLKVQTYLIAKA